MKRSLVLLALVVGSILAGCSGGEVQPEQIDGYQKAGRAADDPVIKATAGGTGADAPGER